MKFILNTLILIFFSSFMISCSTMNDWDVSKIIDKRVAIGLPPDVSTLCDFENKMKHKNLLFANSIDLIFELFNFENKMPINLSQKIFSSINKSKFLKNLSMRFADKGL